MHQPQLPPQLHGTPCKLPTNWSWEQEGYFFISHEWGWQLALRREDGPRGTDVYTLLIHPTRGWLSVANSLTHSYPLLDTEGKQVPSHYSLHSVLAVLDTFYLQGRSTY